MQLVALQLNAGGLWI